MGYRGVSAGGEGECADSGGYRPSDAGEFSDRCDQLPGQYGWAGDWRHSVLGCRLVPILYVSTGCFLLSAIMEIFIHIPLRKSRQAAIFLLRDSAI